MLSLALHFSPAAELAGLAESRPSISCTASKACKTAELKLPLTCGRNDASSDIHLEG